MNISELNYELPTELIAQNPLPHRTASRLLRVHRATRSFSDDQFRNLPTVLRPTDVLVINNTRVLPAKFFLNRCSGGKIEGLYMSSLQPSHWRVMLKGGQQLKIGEELNFSSDEPCTAIVVEKLQRGQFVLSVSPDDVPMRILERVGQMPLPPYLRRDEADRPEDQERYQTVFATQAGAVAAPTAGLHFDRALLDELRSQQITIVEMTLHVGTGTFLPIEVEDLADHKMHFEHYEIAPENWSVLSQAKGQGRRMVAVGTTAGRTLETVAQTGLLCGETNLFIYPPYSFKMIDALITNFHLPGSTLLAFVYALGGTELMRRVYQQAIEQRYRFFSYGDAMLIE